jgi:hypothetical protein
MTRLPEPLDPEIWHVEFSGVVRCLLSYLACLQDDIRIEIIFASQREQTRTLLVKVYYGFMRETRQSRVYAMSRTNAQASRTPPY